MQGLAEDQLRPGSEDPEGEGEVPEVREGALPGLQEGSGAKVRPGSEGEVRAGAGPRLPRCDRTSLRAAARSGTNLLASLIKVVYNGQKRTAYSSS